MPNVKINTTSKLVLKFFSMDSLKDNSISLCMFWDNSLYDPAECVKKITDISSEVEPPF